MTTSEPTTGEIVRALRYCVGKDTICGTACPAYSSEAGCRTTIMKNAADRLENQEQTIAALTARAEQAERDMPWVRLDGYNYFVQVKIFHRSDNNLTVYDQKYGRHTVEYSQVKEWRGLPQDGEGK